MSAGFTREASIPIYDGRVVSLSITTVRAPDGERFDREVITHAGAVAVVPVVGDHVILVGQYRAAIDRVLFEIPAGKRDIPGEAPEVTAGRELEEEIGMRASQLERAAIFYNSPGFCDELTHLYIARGLVEVGRRAQGAEERHMTVVRVPLAAVDDLVASGELRDAKTILGLSLARRARST